MAINGTDKEYYYTVVIPYPVHVWIFRKDPNLTLDELAISMEELENVFQDERDGHNFQPYPELLNQKGVKILEVEECEE